MRNHFRTLLLALLLTTGAQWAYPVELSYHIKLKQPGNPAVEYPLQRQNGNLVAPQAAALQIKESMEKVGDDTRLTLTITAREKVFFNIGIMASSAFDTDECEFYLPGFWYHKNLRSPHEAPSFHTSKSWNFREDRLSAPLSGVFDTKSGRSLTVMRELGPQQADALLTHQVLRFSPMAFWVEPQPLVHRLQDSLCLLLIGCSVLSYQLGNAGSQLIASIVVG